MHRCSRYFFNLVVMSDFKVWNIYDLCDSDDTVNNIYSSITSHKYLAITDSQEVTDIETRERMSTGESDSSPRNDENTLENNRIINSTDSRTTKQHLLPKYNRNCVSYLIVELNNVEFAFLKTLNM